MEKNRACDDSTVGHGIRMTVTPDSAELLATGVKMLRNETVSRGYQ